MPEPEDPHYLYTEKEITRILKRAANLQEESGPIPSSGLSLAELKELATESGLDPRYVAAAAAELNRGETPSEGHNFWGGPMTYSEERVIDGEVSEVMWERMVAEIRKTFKNTGAINSWGHSLEWALAGQAEQQASVTVTSREGKTRIQVMHNAQVLGAVAYGPTMMVGFLMGIIIASKTGMGLPLGILFFLSMMALAFILGRWALTKLSDSEQKKVKTLTNNLERMVIEQAVTQTSQTAKTTTEASTQTNAPLLDVDETTPPQTDALKSQPRLRS